jgi:hypothetical protein
MPVANAQGLSKVHLTLRIVAAVGALVGTGLAIRTSMQMRPLQLAYQRLALSVGNLHIKDPHKIYVTALPSEEKLEWRFRIYLPAKFSGREQYSSGMISAKSPRQHAASNGWSSHSSRNEPKEFLMTVALIKEGKDWYFNMNGDSSRGKSSLDQRLVEIVEGNRPLIIETAGQQQTLEFGIDEPICLLRIRGDEPLEDKESHDPLYMGFYYYLVPSSSVNRFEASQSASGQPVTGAVP